MSSARGVRNLSIVLLCVIGSRALSQRTPALLQGVVIEAGSNTPIAKATVELRSVSGGESVAATTRTDSAGKFYLSAVAPGSYRLIANHAGHVKTEFAQLNPSNPPPDIRIAMT